MADCILCYAATKLVAQAAGGGHEAKVRRALRATRCVPRAARCAPRSAWAAAPPGTGRPPAGRWAEAPKPTLAARVPRAPTALQNPGRDTPPQHPALFLLLALFA